MARFRAPGLRIQIVLALAGLMLLAFVPLFIAVEHIVAALPIGDFRAPVARLVAFTMGIFALAFLVFAYFSLTRLIVRPMDDLVRAADKVASGARTLEVPETGAREFSELGSSLQSMTSGLLANEDALRAKVRELTEVTRSLVEAREHLIRSERLASVGRLAAGIGHEIGNPVAALLGLEDLLLFGDVPEGEQRDLLLRMKKETERIHAVVRDMLDFARPEQELPPGTALPPADLREVLADVRALLAPQRPFQSIVIQDDLDPVSCRVLLPAPRLTQVLLNLLMNAGDALGEASLPRGKKGTIIVRARPVGSNLRIEIEDDGPGVGPAVRDRLFEPFVTTKDVGAGTGLGLAVCRGLVEQIGGSIDHDATYGAGARFVVTLPLAPAATA